MVNIRNRLMECGLYDIDVSYIKQVAKKYKVYNLKMVRKSGLEGVYKKTGKGKSEGKLDHHIRRAKSKIKEYAMCNEWDWFCTFTIDKEKYDRYNLQKYYKDFGRFIVNYNRYCNDDEKVKYLFVPELHKDGAWHIHGLLKGIKSQDMFINENSYISWQQYADKFGYMSFGKIRDHEKVSSYIMKYITKDLSKTVKEYGQHLYYCSKGLKTGEVIYKGKVKLVNTDWDIETEDKLCRIKYFDDIEQLQEHVYVV